MLTLLTISITLDNTVDPSISSAGNVIVTTPGTGPDIQTDPGVHV